MKGKLKNLAAVFALILTLIVTVSFVGCSSAGRAGYLYHSDSDGSNQQKPIVKQLTAAEWRDALNYDFWLNLFEKDIPIKGQNGEENTQDGIFSEYATETRGLETFEMHEVYVSCNDEPVIGAEVSLFNDNDVIFSAVTDSTGIAYVFGNGTHVEAVSGQTSSSAQIAEGVTQISLSDYTECEDEIDIMFVVDTTGSMGDELYFLCNELAGIITRASSALDCKINLGLLFYRDKGDAYVTKKFNFVDVSSTIGLNTVVNNIRAQSSGGGGDYPEAVDTALAEAIEMDWTSNSKTKLLFHVLDAPYHDDQKSQSVFANAVKSAAQKGIRIIPVAASGLDTLGQYIMRSAALLTGGTYTFLTDDSGIGNSHTLPDVGEFTVEYLSDLMVRLIKGYYTGTFEEPIPWTQSESVV
ncbi:MAG: VWA domain-containing protein [Clostridiales bacterium]|nr:VWA domain-containing protein [Clostridiales bacterium]